MVLECWENVVVVGAVIALIDGVCVADRGGLAQPSERIVLDHALVFLGNGGFSRRRYTRDLANLLL